MLIFLPPSEGKTQPTDDVDEPMDLRSLTMPELADERRQVVDALIEASSRDDAQNVLKVGSRVLGEVEANQHMWRAPAGPAHDVYNGVLFDALDAETLTSAQLKRAQEQILIFSGPFGATSFTDRIPMFRCSMDVKLDPLGKLGSWWKKRLAEPLSARVGDQLVIDCRSSSYAQAFASPPEQTLVVNSFTERAGERKVVTHFAKQARGRLTGMLLRADSQPRTIADVVSVASEQWDVEVRPAEGRAPHQLNLIAAED